MSRLTDVSLPLLVKLGSIVIHIDEYLSPNGSPFDTAAINSLLQDPEVTAWLKMMNDAGFLPKKRQG